MSSFSTRTTFSWLNTSQAAPIGTTVLPVNSNPRTVNPCIKCIVVQPFCWRVYKPIYRRRKIWHPLRYGRCAVPRTINPSRTRENSAHESQQVLLSFLRQRYPSDDVTLMWTPSKRGKGEWVQTTAQLSHVNMVVRPRRPQPASANMHAWSMNRISERSTERERDRG